MLEIFDFEQVSETCYSNRLIDNEHAATELFYNKNKTRARFVQNALHAELERNISISSVIRAREYALGLGPIPNCCSFLLHLRARAGELKREPKRLKGASRLEVSERSGAKECRDFIPAWTKHSRPKARQNRGMHLSRARKRRFPPLFVFYPPVHSSLCLYPLFLRRTAFVRSPSDRFSL